MKGQVTISLKWNVASTLITRVHMIIYTIPDSEAIINLLDQCHLLDLQKNSGQIKINVLRINKEAGLLPLKVLLWKLACSLTDSCHRSVPVACTHRAIGT